MVTRQTVLSAPTLTQRRNAVEESKFDIELLTPMLGGGTESYKPDLSMPVRSQAVKGQLRFWWRTTQAAVSPSELRSREVMLWGSVEYPSAVTVAIHNIGPVQHVAHNQAEAEQKFPPYVLFPLPSIDDGNLRIVTAHRFILQLRFSINVPEDDRRAVINAVKLWVLFGGIGARTRRGCGSLNCPALMEELPTAEAIATFVGAAGVLKNEKAYGTSPWPRLRGGALFLRRSPETDPTVAWKNFLDRYAGFRQGRGIGREHGKGNRPGRTYWPEADSLRRITGVYGHHRPVHPAGNWFPRGAYGMPVEFEFRNESTDPIGRKFLLQPERHERWPSPIVLKIIKLADGSLIETCLILNAALPESLAVKEGRNTLHSLSSDEYPLSHSSKNMPSGAPLQTAEHPYTALARHLRLQEVQP